MSRLSVGIQPQVAVDLVKPRQNDGVFLQGSVYLSWDGWGPLLSLGYRFEAATRPGD